MHIMAGLDGATSGRAWIGDTEITGLSDLELTILRRRRIGFVFQAFNLVPTLDALGNITLPFDLDGRRPTALERARIDGLIDTLGCGRACSTGRTSSPVVSSSASRSPAPSRPPRPRLRRRADRQPRLALEPRSAGPARRSEPRARAVHRDGDARPGRRIARRPRAVPRRRPVVADKPRRRRAGLGVHAGRGGGA
jgi:ABC-type sugar transport system ATPase subunit